MGVVMGEIITTAAGVLPGTNFNRLILPVADTVKVGAAPVT